MVKEDATIKDAEVFTEEEMKISNEDQINSGEVNQKDLKIAIISMVEVDISVTLYAENVTKFVIMQRIVAL